MSQLILHNFWTDGASELILSSKDAFWKTVSGCACMCFRFFRFELAWGQVRLFSRHISKTIIKAILECWWLCSLCLKPKELDVYGLRHRRERSFAHILTSKLVLFDKETKELLQKTVAEVTYENFTKSKVIPPSSLTMEKSQNHELT